MKNLSENLHDLNISELEELYNLGALEGIVDLRLSYKQFFDISSSFLTTLLKKGILHTETE
jgi:hypothetical protein